MAVAAKKTARQVVTFKPKGTGRRSFQELVAKARRLRGQNVTIGIEPEIVEALAEAIEDMEDVALSRSRAGEPNIPHAVAMAILSGTHPVRAWRKHKGLTIQQLADAVEGITVGYLSEIETGKKPGSVAAYKALAKALGTGIDMLVAE